MADARGRDVESPWETGRGGSDAEVPWETGTRKFGLDRRPPRYISKKEQRERGWFFQPAPLLKNIAGIRFPKLRELTLVYIDLDTNSFAGTRRRV